jgi:hypothetical protein
MEARDRITVEDIRGMVEVKLDQAIEEKHSILEVVIKDGDEFYDAYAVIAVQRADRLVDDTYHRWVIVVHGLKVTAWGDILHDVVINQYGINNDRQIDSAAGVVKTL